MTGLCALLATWGAGEHLRGVPQDLEGIMAHSERVLALLVEACIGEAVFDWYGAGIRVRCNAGRVDIEEICTDLGFSNLARCLEVDEGPTKISCVMVQLAACVYDRRSYRNARFKQRTQELFALLVDVVASAVELGRVSSITDNLACLGNLHLSSVRPRRISSARKRALVAVATDACGLNSVVGVCAVQERLAVASQGRKSNWAGQSARHFVRDVMYQYWLAGRQALHGARILCMVTDGGRVSGDELQTTVLWGAEKRLGVWCPPAVFGIARITPESALLHIAPLVGERVINCLSGRGG